MRQPLERVILSVKEGSYKQITPIMYILTEQEHFKILGRNVQILDLVYSSHATAHGERIYPR